MSIIRKIFLLLVLTAVLFPPRLSLGTITFQNQSSGGINTEAFSPQINEFINGLKDINGKINSKVGQYLNVSPAVSPINFNQINRLNIAQWLENIIQLPVIRDIYPLIAKILQLVGNLIIWILGLVTDLIKQGLAVLQK